MHFPASDKGVRDLLVKYYNNPFPFFVVTLFPSFSMILFNTKTSQLHQCKGSNTKACSH